jgi:hypothetical protein
MTQPEFQFSQPTTDIHHSAISLIKGHPLSDHPISAIRDPIYFVDIYPENVSKTASGIGTV